MSARHLASGVGSPKNVRSPIPVGWVGGTGGVGVGAEGVQGASGMQGRVTRLVRGSRVL